jgi:TolB-like protein
MKFILVSFITLLILTVNFSAQPKVVVTDASKKANKPATQNTADNGDLDSNLKDLSRQISDGLTENQKKTIAVIEFVDLKGNVTDFGRYLSEELITRLYQTKKFKVIERQMLNKVITEQKLSLTGIIDPTSAQKLGKLLGVDAIASGSVSDLGKTLKVNARLISTETAEVFSVASVTLAKDDSVCTLLGSCKNTSTAQTDDDWTPIVETKPTPKPKPTPVKPKSWIVDSGLFTFELHRCKASGNIVACDFTITNNDTDKRLSVGWEAKLYDDFNNEVKQNRAELANESGSWATAFLVNGVATKARVFFEGISPNATRATLIKFNFKAENSSWFEIQFRNIPLRENVSQIDETETNKNSYTYQYAEKKEFRIYPNSGAVDSGVDVAPNRKVEVTVSGNLTRKIDNSPIGNIIGGILKKQVNVPPTIQKIGPTALFSTIKFPNGKSTGVVSVGTKKVFTLTGEETGRLFFAIDSKYSASEGYFDVTLNW